MRPGELLPDAAREQETGAPRRHTVTDKVTERNGALHNRVLFRAKKFSLTIPLIVSMLK